MGGEKDQFRFLTTDEFKAIFEMERELQFRWCAPLTVLDPPDADTALMRTEQEIYKQALIHACMKALYEIDAMLRGKAEGARYQLVPDQYAQARECFAHLYTIVTRPRLERTPIGRARDESAFEDFLVGLTRRRRHRPQV